MLFQVESDNKVKFGNQTSYLVASTTTLVTGVWYHVAVARQSGTLRLFINGVLEASSADSTNYSQGTNRPTIGTTGFNFGFNDFFGYISNLRVVKGTAVYTSAFTSPSTPLQPIAGTSLLTCADNRVADKSSNNFTITRGGDVSVQRSSPFSNTTLSASTYSVYFDGSGDYLRTTGLVLNNGAFTISFYFYPTTASVIGLFDSAPGTASTFRNYPANTIQDQNGGSVAFTANTNQWNWMSIVGDGSNFTVYLNGSSVGTAAYAGLVDSSFTLGTINSGGDGAYTGYISNFRIKNIASVDSVPTSSLTAVTGTTFLVCQSDRIVDNSANAYSITIAGDARPSTFSPFTPTYINKQSYSAAVFGGSMYSDGTGDYLNINNVPAIGTGDFTIECWVYPTTLGSFDGFISSAMDGGGAIGVSLSRDQAWIGNNSTIAISYSWSSLILTGRWTHLAVTRQGSTVRFFVNGVVVSSGSASTNIASTTYAIGRRYPNWDSAYPTGYISDARVINGTALYTSSFVPPTAPVTARQNTVLLLNATSAGIFDAATQAVYETVGDTKINTSVVKFAGGSSVYLDGTGDYMLVKPTVNLEFGSGDFTIEFWLYRVGTGRMALYHGSFGTDWSVGIDISSVSPFTSNTIGIWASSNGTSWNLVNADSGGNGVGTIAVAQNTWTHIAYVRNGTTWMSFVNGVRDRNITGVSGSIVDRATSQKAIAAWFSDASMAKINGYISDFRITKGLARYTANFTPPTSALLTK
jgi:hypothetical protein